jgi:hypothetical protein
MRHATFAATLLVGALSLAACGVTDSVPDRSPAGDLTRIELQAHLADCTRQHGYAPDQSDALEPHALAPGEREWRACAYRAIEEVVIPRARAPENFRTLIAADRRLTDDVAAGNTARSERRQRILAMLDRAMVHESDIERTAWMQPWPQSPAYYSTGSADNALSVHHNILATMRGGLR